MTDIPPELRDELLVKRLAVQCVGSPVYSPSEAVDESPSNPEYPTPTMDLDDAKNLCRDLKHLTDKESLSRKQRRRRHTLQQRFENAANMTFGEALERAENGLEGPIKEVAKYLY